MFGSYERNTFKLSSNFVKRVNPLQPWPTPIKARFSIINFSLAWVSAFLILLGVITIKSDIDLNKTQVTKFEKKYFLQGLIVILTNPKIFVFFGAFIPQFININEPVSHQIIYFGIIFIIVATIFDSSYAFVFGKFREFIASKYLKVLNKIGGFILILVGIWMFFY